jgi:virulence-associated protein VapD
MPAVAEMNVTANTYYQLIRELQISGFNRLQKSDYMNPAASTLTTWNTMLGLLNIQPPGKLESTIRGLHLYRLDPNQVMDVTPFVKLGGMYCQGLRGPTPRDLTFVPPAVGPLVPVPVVPAAMALPVHTQATPAAGILANWRG